MGRSSAALTEFCVRPFLFTSESSVAGHDGQAVVADSERHNDNEQDKARAIHSTWEVFGLQVRLERYEIFITGDRLLEHGRGSAYLLWGEHRDLRAIGGSRTTAHTPSLSGVEI
jgi:hypothetical protein